MPSLLILFDKIGGKEQELFIIIVIQYDYHNSNINNCSSQGPHFLFLMFPGLKLHFPSEQLLRCTGMNSYVLENHWSLTSKHLPKSFRNVYAVGPKTADDLMAIGTVKNLDYNSEYLRQLVAATLVCVWGCAHVRECCIPNQILFIWLIPSGRFPSERYWPVGSNCEGTLAATSNWHMMSLIAAWRGSHPSLHQQLS